MKSYKILLLGEASNFHRCLAIGLRRMGHQVTIASAGSGWMKIARDIDLSRKCKGKLGGLCLWLKALKYAKFDLKGFDIVSVIGNAFIELKPNRTARIFDIIRRNNKCVIYNYLGTDPAYIDYCFGKTSALRYNEWQVDGAPTEYAMSASKKLAEWDAPALRALCDKFYTDTDGTIAALYEYYQVAATKVAPDRLAYGGIPIDCKSIAPSYIPETPEKVKLMIAIHRNRMKEKGTDRLLAAAQRLVATYPDRCELDVVMNLPYQEFLKRIEASHIVLDQLYSYTPATTAMLAMAYGKVAVSGGESEFYDFISENENRPIQNVVPDDNQIYSTLENLVLNPDKLRSIGIASREFVEKHNDVDIVARRFIQFYEQLNGRK